MGECGFGSVLRRLHASGCRIWAGGVFGRMGWCAMGGDEGSRSGAERMKGYARSKDEEQMCINSHEMTALRCSVGTREMINH